MKNKGKLKERVCIYLDSELHDYARKKGFNLSGFLENALKRLKLNLTDENDNSQTANNADLVLICQNKLNFMPSAGIEPATYRSSVCRSPY